MVAMRYYGNVMTTTMSQYSDDVGSVTHAGCICAPVNAITTCIYFTHRSDHILHLQQYSHRLNLLYRFIFQQYVCYTTILNMFRAARCSSSGGQIVSPQVYRISEYKSDLEDKLQTHNKINGAIRRHFGKQMNKETKLSIHNLTVKAALKFVSEACVLKKREEQRLEAAQMKFLKHLLGITKLDKEKNQCVRRKNGSTEHSKENETVPEKVATTRTKNGQK